MSSGESCGFLRIGVIRENLNSSRNVPVVRNRLMRNERGNENAGESFFNSQVGNMSSGEDLDGSPRRRCSTSSRVTGVKSCMVGGIGRRNDDDWSLEVTTGTCCLMRFTLESK